MIGYNSKICELFLFKCSLEIECGCFCMPFWNCGSLNLYKVEVHYFEWQSCECCCKVWNHQRVWRNEHHQKKNWEAFIYEHNWYTCQPATI